MDLQFFFFFFFFFITLAFSNRPPDLEEMKDPSFFGRFFMRVLLVKHQRVQPVGRNLCRIVEAMRILASFVRDSLMNTRDDITSL